MEWLNISGVIFMILLLIPNIIFMKNQGSFENHDISSLWIIFEQIGRFGSMFFMCFQIGFGYDGFSTTIIENISLIVNSVILSLYWCCWYFFSKHENLYLALALAILPSMLFIGSAILSRNYLLLTTGMIFAIAHIYITYQNARRKADEKV